jgi:AraC family transcriptional regulator
MMKIDHPFANMQRVAAEAAMPDPANPKRYAAVLARLLEAADDALARDPGSAKCCIARALALLEDSGGSANLESPRIDCALGGLAPWQVRKLVGHVAANCTERLRTGDLAQIAKLSTSYFIRAFKVTFGETPHAYVIRCRIELAKGMMLETDTALGHIAAACGFSDQAHFSRRFRDLVGMPPQRWRSVRLADRPADFRGAPASARI